MKRVVKTAKDLIVKSEDPYLALLSYRSTPLENGYTPAELLMGRKLRSTLPLAPEKLTPKLWATLIFTKTRFCSHINFIGRCLQSKVFPKGFRSNFHASSFSRSNQYLYQIQCAQNSFSRNIMRITIRAMCLKRDVLDKQILQCRSELSKICPVNVVLLNSIRARIQELNATLYDHLHQIKTLKLEHLIRPKISSHATFDSQNIVVTIPENLPLTDSEKSVPIAKSTDEFSVKQDVEKFVRRIQLKAFFHDKEDNSNASDKDIFETLHVRKSKWPPPEGQFASLVFSIKNAVMTFRSSNSIVTLNFPTFLPKRGWLLKISASDMTLLSNRPTKAAR